MGNEDKKFEDSLDFVATHYDPEAFSPKEGWKNVRVETRHFWWRRWGVAAGVACVVLAASAFVYINRERAVEGADKEQAVLESDTHENMTMVSRRIEFSDAALNEIVGKIETTYKVKVVDVPSEEIRLTLSYEGTASDLIDLINEMAGTHMRVED